MRIADIKLDLIAAEIEIDLLGSNQMLQLLKASKSTDFPLGSSN